jgi:hypothetical protein
MIDAVQNKIERLYDDMWDELDDSCKRVNVVTTILATIIEKQEEYIDILADELNQTAEIATAHGWSSTKHREALELRKEIGNLKRKIR